MKLNSLMVSGKNRSVRLHFVYIFVGWREESPLLITLPGPFHDKEPVFTCLKF